MEKLYGRAVKRKSVQLKNHHKLMLMSTAALLTFGVINSGFIPTPTPPPQQCFQYCTTIPGKVCGSGIRKGSGPCVLNANNCNQPGFCAPTPTPTPTIYRPPTTRPPTPTPYRPTPTPIGFGQQCQLTCQVGQIGKPCAVGFRGANGCNYNYNYCNQPGYCVTPTPFRAPSPTPFLHH